MTYDDPVVQGLALVTRASRAEARGDLEGSAADYEAARDLLRHAGSLRLLGLALMGLAAVRTAQARYADARRALEEAQSVLQRLVGGGESECLVATDEGLVVGPDAAWFQSPGAPRADLTRRGATRRIFAALVEERLAAPGVGLGPHALAERGWPGEKMRPDAAATRVYAAIRTLRTLGLGPALLRHADGYLLDPSLPIARAPSGAEQAGMALRSKPG